MKIHDQKIEDWLTQSIRKYFYMYITDAVYKFLSSENSLAFSPQQRLRFEQRLDRILADLLLKHKQPLLVYVHPRSPQYFIKIVTLIKEIAQAVQQELNLCWPNLGSDRFGNQIETLIKSALQIPQATINHHTDTRCTLV